MSALDLSKVPAITAALSTLAPLLLDALSVARCATSSMSSCAAPQTTQLMATLREDRRVDLLPQDGQGGGGNNAGGGGAGGAGGSGIVIIRYPRS